MFCFSFIQVSIIGNGKILVIFRIFFRNSPSVKGILTNGLLARVFFAILIIIVILFATAIYNLTNLHIPIPRSIMIALPIFLDTVFEWAGLVVIKPFSARGRSLLHALSYVGGIWSGALIVIKAYALAVLVELILGVSILGRLVPSLGVLRLAGVDLRLITISLREIFITL